MIATKNSEDLEARHTRKLILEHLARCSAMRHDRLADLTGVDETVLKRQLDVLMCRGEVELMRPLSDTRINLPDDVARQRTFYRLVRDTDRDFLWEEAQIVLLPVGRMADVRVPEARPIRSVPRVVEEVWG